MSIRPARRSAPPLAVVRLAVALRRLLLRAADAVVPGYLAVYDKMMGAPTTVLLHVVARLRIPDLIEEHGPLTADELAARTGSDADALGRVMRALVSSNVFQRAGDDRFAHNGVSRALITGRFGTIRGFAEFFGLPPLLRAWAELPQTVARGGSAFGRAHGRDIWAWMGEDDVARAAFVEGMSDITEQAAPSIAAAYPFNEVRRLCDVGGGSGMVLAAVLAWHPHLEGVLYDAPEMLAEAPPRLAANGVSDRVECVPGSFFERVPSGCDAYLIKTVLHNWPDEGALKILENCRAAMRPGQRLIVVDFLYEPERPSTLISYMDIAGLAIYADGRERRRADFERLFQKAGFRIGRVRPIPGDQAVIEGVAVA
ncbi:MAG: hypothetical protein KC468_07115 [Myxococcales bacterium]|nr:hypothetical protein [Myxococcales bacterium]